MHKKEAYIAAWSAIAIAIALPAGADTPADADNAPVIPVAPESPAEPPDARTSAGRTIDVILVTAQKREQVMLDVPVSMMAVDHEFLAAKGITDLSELSNHIPNVKLRTDVGSGIDLNIRGFSKQSGNPAFDQAVGLLVDGVPYNDNDFFITGMVDIERIEVLRGPQGTLLGKNTTAGLLNIVTRRPSDHFSGYFDVQAGEFRQRRYEGAFGGPLWPGVANFRIALLDDQRDGVIRNTTAAAPEDPRSFVDGTPSRLLTRDRQVVRAKLEFPDLFGSTWGLQYEHADIVALGNGGEIVDIDSDSEAYLRQYDPDMDITPGNFVSSTNDASHSDRTVKRLVGSWTRALGDWDLRVTAGYAKVDGLVEGGDGTPAPLFGLRLFTDKPQTNLDFVVSSPRLFGERLDFTGGVFLEQRELDLDSTLAINTEPFLGLLVASDTGVILPPNILPPVLPIPLPIDELLLSESSTIFFEQRTRDMAVYGQANWQLAPRWMLTTGLRLSYERKRAEWERVFNTANALFLSTTLGWEEFEAERKRSETTLQPKIALNYKPVDNISLFVHWARGYRSGGYNSAAGRDEGLEYDRELLDEYALNVKTRLLDDTLMFNFGVFYMALRDFQLLTSGPDDISIIALNAGRARARGAEADLTWLPTRWLAVSTALAYNDAEFTEFPFGPCPPGQPNEDGDDPRCDLTGEALPFSPEWTGALSLNLDAPFGGRWPLRFLAGLTVEYQTRSVTGLPGDPRQTQGSYARLDGSVGIAGSERGWTLRITGKNLTDRAINRGVGNIPPADILAQQLEPPRSVYAQLRWNFR